MINVALGKSSKIDSQSTIPGVGHAKGPLQKDMHGKLCKLSCHPRA
jgi:hypothetical protein